MITVYCPTNLRLKAPTCTDMLEFKSIDMFAKSTKQIILLLLMKLMFLTDVLVWQVTTSNITV